PLHLSYRHAVRCKHHRDRGPRLHPRGQHHSAALPGGVRGDAPGNHRAEGAELGSRSSDPRVHDRWPGHEVRAAVSRSVRHLLGTGRPRRPRDTRGRHPCPRGRRGALNVARVAPGGSGMSKGADGRPVELALVPDDMVLRNVVSAVADGIVVVDPAGVVIFANPAAEDLFGRPLQELIYAEFGFPLGAGETTEIELLVPGGMSRVVEMRVTETTWEDKRVNVAALRDVGPRRQTERALEAAVEQRDVVLAAASHEMRSPLAVITGMTEILHDSWADLSEDKKLDLVDLIGKQ